ncbi:MAG: hypothetical protein EOP10_22935 [Proteobacteria bacterium]|nr:MAG: hypothetical protein EOP10_22935 [Pseudomonadota bacterium]
MKLSLHSKHLALPLMMLALSLSCKHEHKSGLESEVSGSAVHLPSNLGVGFDSETQGMKSQCVTGSTEWRGENEASIVYGQDLSFNDIMKSYGGGAKVGATVYGFEVGGAAEFASKNATTEFSSSISLVNKVSLKKLLLSNPKLTEDGKKELVEDRARDTVRETCGNEFFSAIVYGAQIFVVAKFDFASAQDKIEFKGNASVSLLGVGEIGGNISHLSDKVKKTGRVTISARQVGGNPEELSKILGSGLLISCSLVDYEKTCLPALQAIVKYASDDFRVGLKSTPDPQIQYEQRLEAEAALKPGEKLPPKNPGDAKGWAEVNFITSKYSDVKVGGARLVPDVDVPLVNAEIERTRSQVYDEFQVQLMDSERAANLLSVSTLSDIKQLRISEIYKATEANKKALAIVGENCMIKPSKCVESYANYKSTQMKVYDERQLSLGICLVKSDMDNSSWVLKGDANKALGTVRFNPDGKLEGYASDTEKTWKVDGCILRFYNEADVASTIFGKIEESGNAMSGQASDNSIRSLTISK